MCPLLPLEEKTFVPIHSCSTHRVAKDKKMAFHYSFLSDIIQNLAKIRSDTKEDRSSMRRRGGVVDSEEDCQ